MADNYSQIYTFIMYSLLIGFLLGAVYDVFRIIRMAFSLGTRRLIANIAAFVCDILFFVIAAVVSAIFIFYVNNGRIRGIALFGSLVGFILYYNTVGRLVSLVSYFIISTVKRILVFILTRLILPVLRFISGLTDLIFTVSRMHRKTRSVKKKGC